MPASTTGPPTIQNPAVANNAIAKSQLPGTSVGLGRLLIPASDRQYSINGKRQTKVPINNKGMSKDAAPKFR